jgi:hypothetical protein
MRLAAELAAGLVAGGIAYYLARPDTSAPEAVPRSVQPAADRRDEQPRRDRADRAALVPPAAVAHSELTPSPEQDRAMTMLRNAAIMESARGMHSRGEDLAACFDGARPAGAEKLRFAVEVASIPAQATLGRWRFVEVADGEPVPASFAACAERVLGAGQQLVPPAGFRFPDYHGELSFVFTVPAPADE